LAFKIAVFVQLKICWRFEFDARKLFLLVMISRDLWFFKSAHIKKINLTIIKTRPKPDKKIQLTTE